MRSLSGCSDQGIFTRGSVGHFIDDRYSHVDRPVSINAPAKAT